MGLVDRQPQLCGLHRDVCVELLLIDPLEALDVLVSSCDRGGFVVDLLTEEVQRH